MLQTPCGALDKLAHCARAFDAAEMPTLLGLGVVPEAGCEDGRGAEACEGREMVTVHCLRQGFEVKARARSKQEGRRGDHSRPLGLSGFHNLLFGDFIFGGGPLLFSFFLPAFFSSYERKNLTLISLFSFLNFALLFCMLPYPHKFVENRYYVVSYSLLTVAAGAGLEYVRSLFKKKFRLDVPVLACLLSPAWLLLCFSA